MGGVQSSVYVCVCVCKSDGKVFLEKMMYDIWFEC